MLSVVIPASGALRPWLEWSLLLASLAAFTITERYQPSVTVGLVLLAASFFVRVGRTGRLFPRTGLELPWALFAISAAISVGVAYDQPAALLQLARILAAAAWFYAIVESEEQTVRLAAVGFVLAAVVLALYWPLQNDFAANPGKFAPITTAGLWLNARAPAPPGPAVHANVAAGVLALAVPFALSLVWVSLRSTRRARRTWPWFFFLSLLSFFLIVLGLLFTGSRGGWLGVAAASGLAALVGIQKRWFAPPGDRAWFWAAVLVLGLVLGGGLAATGTLERLLGQVPDPNGALQNRPELWRQGLPLLRDYAFTGIGLMNFSHVYGVYGLLIDTPYLSHLHNAFLEVWLEQGVLGPAALAWAVVVAGRWAWVGTRRPDPPDTDGRDNRLLAWAGFFALAGAAVHGVFDVTFYVERTLPLLGLALGFAAGVGTGSMRNEPKAGHALLDGVSSRWIFAALAVVLAIPLALSHRTLAAAWNANLGAAIQSRTELRLFDPVHFDDPTIDQIRRTTDLSAAEAYFDRSLALDPGNPTALARLAQIALSRGDYDRALAMMQTARAAGQRGDVSVLLLGDALVAAGRIEDAVEVLRGLTWAESRLRAQAWYRYWVNEDYRRASDAWQTVLLLDPESTDLVPWIAEAERLAGGNEP